MKYLILIILAALFAFAAFAIAQSNRDRYRNK